MSRWTTEKRLNAEIAERIFGWKWMHGENWETHRPESYLVSPTMILEQEYRGKSQTLSEAPWEPERKGDVRRPSKGLQEARYATDTEEALKVVRELQSRGYTVTLTWGPETVFCEVSCYEGKWAGGRIFKFNPVGTMAYTICEVAIKVLNEEWT